MKLSLIRTLLLLAMLAPAPMSVAYADPLDQARTLMRQGRHDAALEQLDARLSASPGDPMARFLKGVALAEAGRREEAIDAFSALTREYPELPEPHNNLAVLYAAGGELEKARASLIEALRLHPNYSTAHENLGDLYGKMAVLAHSKALDLNGGAAGDGPEAGAGKVALREIPAAEDSVIEARVLTAVADWAEAWSRQDVDAYLAHYADAFEPADGRSRNNWELLRHKRLTGPAFIELEISRARVAVQGAGRASVTFEQSYRSDGYSDRVSKRLDLVQQGQGWKIVSERTLE